jgi:hypothetical protein
MFGTLSPPPSPAEEYQDLSVNGATAAVQRRLSLPTATPHKHASPSEGVHVIQTPVTEPGCDDCWTMLSTPSSTGEYQQLSVNTLCAGISAAFCTSPHRTPGKACLIEVFSCTQNNTVLWRSRWTAMQVQPCAPDAVEGLGIPVAHPEQVPTRVAAGSKVVQEHKQSTLSASWAARVVACRDSHYACM